MIVGTLSGKSAQSKNAVYRLQYDGEALVLFTALSTPFSIQLFGDDTIAFLNIAVKNKVKDPIGEDLNGEPNAEQAEAVKDFFCNTYWGVIADDMLDLDLSAVFQFDELEIFTGSFDEAALEMLFQENHFDPDRLIIRIKRGWITIT